jgi:hypothetical protein
LNPSLISELEHEEYYTTKNFYGQVEDKPAVRNIYYTILGKEIVMIYTVLCMISGFHCEVDPRRWDQWVASKSW